MAGKAITHFDPDPAKLSCIGECMENYDVGSPDADWPNNIISRKAIVYGSGVIARQGNPVRHAVDPDELALCQRLAGAVARLMKGVPVGMGSEGSDEFHQFFIAANLDEPPPSVIDEELIRSKFGGTIFPLATITVEPLVEEGTWWEEVQSDGSESGDEYFGPWRKMIEWFHSQPELTDSAFVRIGDQEDLSNLDQEQYPEGTENTGCVLPRLALGLTANGSLVGLFGYSVQT